MANYKILYWHGIPSQVRATDEDGRVGKQLPARFQETIDDAAMALGLFGSEEYTDGFQWGEEIDRAGSAQEVADAVVAELDAKFQRIDWRATVNTLGKRKR